ncbi:hypothetical protein EYW49_13395 [Siculibacillus lacustris]|uniref:DUF4384 domain-containing protein n=1 Tax=Siculibacillus lacustris TaxID=1549641 RepID=A0A4Q9VMA1_9HYPH|nr:hypothetical protein [Siculibacillus lacustris]TBW36589.1 hypothetical protein EYW49_13395 [Siculibacillus lacustris]
MTDRRSCLRFALIWTLAVAAPVAAAPLVVDEGGSLLRGIVTDQSVDLPLDPSRADAPRPTSAVAPVRLAPKKGEPAVFDGLTGRLAPLEFVRADVRPDLVWDPASGELSERGDVVALAVDRADLPGAADRVALIRRVRELVQRAGQTMRLQPDDRAARLGARVELQISDVAGRSVAVFSVDGIGRTTLLYPTKLDPTVIAAPDLAVPLDASAPTGTDNLVVLSTTGDLSGFVRSLRRLDRRRAAGEALGLLDAVDGGDLRVGTRALMVQP